MRTQERKPHDGSGQGMHSRLGFSLDVPGAIIFQKARCLLQTRCELRTGVGGEEG